MFAGDYAVLGVTSIDCFGSTRFDSTVAVATVVGKLGLVRGVAEASGVAV